MRGGWQRGLAVWLLAAMALTLAASLAAAQSFPYHGDSGRTVHGELESEPEDELNRSRQSGWAGHIGGPGGGQGAGIRAPRIDPPLWRVWWEHAKAKVGDWWNGAKEFGKDAWDWIVDTGEAAWEWAKGAWRWTRDRAVDWWNQLSPSTRGFLKGLAIAVLVVVGVLLVIFVGWAVAGAIAAGAAGSGLLAALASGVGAALTGLAAKGATIAVMTVVSLLTTGAYGAMVGDKFDWRKGGAVALVSALTVWVGTLGVVRAMFSGTLKQLGWSGFIGKSLTGAASGIIWEFGWDVMDGTIDGSFSDYLISAITNVIFAGIGTAASTGLSKVWPHARTLKIWNFSVGGWSLRRVADLFKRAFRSSPKPLQRFLKALTEQRFANDGLIEGNKVIGHTLTVFANLFYKTSSARKFVLSSLSATFAAFLEGLESLFQRFIKWVRPDPPQCPHRTSVGNQIQEGSDIG